VVAALLDRRDVSGGHDVSVAVVIATRDRPALLRGALEALCRSVRPAERVVVVDSASTDPAVRQVAAQAGADVVRCELPGLGRARNAGWRAVEEDLVAFTDDDCLPDPEWVGAVVAAFGGPDLPDFVTGRVRSDEEPGRRAGMTVALTAGLVPRTLGSSDDPRRFGHGANMAWRRRALERIGGFDEAMGVGSLLRAAEDTDAFWRTVHHGGSGRFDPGVVVAHRLWRSRRTMLRSFRGYGVGAGALAVKRYRMTATADAAALSRLRRSLLGEGVRPIIGSLRRGHQMDVLADSLMWLGGLEGARLAWRLPVVDGHFVVRPERSIGPWRAGR
jgi:glycosyltransferase involved in cell wall biosynthesis